jgi:hypothetical protein
MKSYVASRIGIRQNGWRLREGTALVAVLSSGEPREALTAFLEKHHPDFPVSLSFAGTTLESKVGRTEKVQIIYSATERQCVESRRKAAQRPAY